MNNFKLYADYYNLIYQDKDYQGEVDYIHKLILNNAKLPVNKILDIGCGTGTHANLLSNLGYKVVGIDLSKEMIDQAKNNHKNNENLSFDVGNATSFKLNEKFDVITSLFHVVSYQTTNQDLINTFESINYHLNDDGVLIFDFWYGPGVLTDLPEDKFKCLENDIIKVEREAKPVIYPERNVVDVNYDVKVFSKEKQNIDSSFKECHSMRYLFLPEIKYYLEQTGLTFLTSFEWRKDTKPGLNTWNVVVIAKKKKDEGSNMD